MREWAQCSGSTRRPEAGGVAPGGIQPTPLPEIDGMIRPSHIRLPRFGPCLGPPSRGRVFALDGLRGWASLSVVCFHLLWETFGEVDPSIRNGVTAFLLDGSLAVSIFFVLSGEALSSSYFSGGGRRSVLDLAVRRYPRLVIPVLAVSVVTFAITALDLNSNVPAGRIVGRPDWLGSWIDFAPSVSGLIRFALLDVFTDIAPAQSLVPFLWTMRLELIGSALTFAILILCHGRRYGWHAVLIGLALMMTLYVLGRSVLFGNLSCFVVGMICAKLRFDGVFDAARTGERAFYLSSGAIVALLAIDGALHSRGFGSLRCPLFAMVLVVLFSCNSLAERAMTTRLSRYLGRISFPLFLVQFPVIISLTSWMIVANERTGSKAPNGVIFLLSLLACLVMAELFMPVERFTARFCRFLSRRVFPAYASVTAGRRGVVGPGSKPGREHAPH